MKQQLGYGEFLELVRCRAGTALEEKGMDGQLRLGKIVKNNGVILDTLVYRPGGAGTSPSIHMQELYRRYANGADIETIIGQVCGMVEQYHGQVRRIDPEQILDYERIKDRIRIKAVNWEKNEEHLSDRPYLRRLDLALTFYVSMETADGTICSCEITKALADVWKKDTDSLYHKALGNMQRENEEALEPLDDLLGLCCGYEGEDRRIDPDAMADSTCDAEDLSAEEAPARIYVLSNRNACSGAAVMFTSSKLKDLAEKENADLYILPSSIHEVLLLPVTCGMDGSCLKEIVMHVNQEAVEAQEFLSDHVYRYIRRKDEIIIEA